MSVRRIPQLYNGSGQPISLGSELARGGEGGVYEVQQQSGLVAKVYHEAVPKEKTEKLATMVSLRTDQLLKLTAWTISTLHDRPGGIVKGFLMNRVSNYKEIHIL